MSRVCSSFIRGVYVLNRRNVVYSRQESALWFPISDIVKEFLTSTKIFIFTPVRFITSETFLNRLMKCNAPAEADGTVCPLQASVPADSGEQMSLLLRHPDQPERSKVLKVAILGAPNAGKSTLSNQLLGRKVFAVSKKVHTTQSRALAVITEDDTQIILLDTPGIISASKVKRHNLEKSLLVDPWDTIKEANLVVVVVDASDKWTSNRLDFEMLKCLAQHKHIPAVLVLNKVDLVKNKERLLNVTSELTCGIVNGRRMQVRPVIKPPWAIQWSEKDEDTEEEEESTDLNISLSNEELRTLRGQQGWPHFKDVFMLSSVDAEDVKTLKDYFKVAAKPGSWLYHSEVLTDLSPEQVCVNLIRERLLEILPQEVPYSMTQVVDLWHEGENGAIIIAVKVWAKKDAHVRMLIGPGGQTIAQIAKEVSGDLRRIYLREVDLKLGVKLRK
ncbi:GTPase Era, mitochondrial [Cynoglossus semilaevis]|uniref:GTPase Era, mitochondrial n=1 Tax=Cynoglossus semilaevis TaxID=244447 RepID=UPI000D627FAF|nr:GTPase Era, mitochondrial [Cynoglossus semilaevis]